MPVHVLVEGAGPGAQLPVQLTRMQISSLSIGTDSAETVVKGKVFCKGPLVSSAVNNFLLKAVIQEEDSPQKPSINVVLLGALAKEFSQAVNQGDVVAASGFTVGKSPTVHKDKLHACNLLLSGEDASIYVFRPPPPPDPRSTLASKRSAALATQVSRAAKAPKYTYTRLNDLMAPCVVNVYGVVTFFKQPFKSRGTDWCSSMKITDQSDTKIGCTIFSEKLESHPKIFQNGDIIRMHRVKTQSFNNTITLVNTFGFSALTFDGAVGQPVEPRTSSLFFHFDQEDRRRVEELRSWASSQALLPPETTPIPLSAVQPKTYFDLTCQLLAKAPMDSTCTLLRVWDGTRCPHTLLKVMVEPNVVDGPTSFSEDKESLIANVFIYDNHVEFAQQLKPGAFLRIYNLRAVQGSSKVPGFTPSQSEEVNHLTFILHGGTSFGRGIRVLSENSSEVQELKRAIEAFPEDDDLDLLEVWSTPPESLGEEEVECSTGRETKQAEADGQLSTHTPVSAIKERSGDLNLPLVTLSELKRSDPGGIYHVRAQLRSYQPLRLHQALKLYCSKCLSMQDLPDGDLVASIFSEASRDPEPCSPVPWALSGHVPIPGESPSRALTVHLSTQLVSEGKSKAVIFLMGSTLEETCRLADTYQNIIPVRSSGGDLALLDLTAPFLFRGRKRYYGCKRCSEPTVKEPILEGVETIDEKVVAEAVGVRPLQPVMLMQLELQDATGTLDVFLWKHAESFFNVSAEDAATNQEAQDSIRCSMEALCPPGGSTARRPWLSLCVAVYRAQGHGEHSDTCYQIWRPGSEPTATPSDPTGSPA